MEKYQFISWFPEWRGFSILKLKENYPGGLGTIFDWFMFVGFWEIRKWKKSRPGLKEKKMDIKEIADMRNRLAKEISDAIRKFTKETSLVVTRIDVQNLYEYGSGYAGSIVQVDVKLP